MFLRFGNVFGEGIALDSEGQSRTSGGQGNAQMDIAIFGPGKKEKVRHAQWAGHRGVVFEFIRLAFLFHRMEWLARSLYWTCGSRRTFSRLAVSGSMTARKSFANCVTLGPISPAPMRMTMLFGRRVPRRPFSAASSCRVCVLFFFLGLAILFLAKGRERMGREVGGRGEVKCKGENLTLSAFLEISGG